MARNGAGRDPQSGFRHPLLAMSRLSQRTPLRVKLITALLALVALALAVISFTSAAVFQRYLVDQADNQLSGLNNAQTSLRAINNGGPGTGSGFRYLAIPPGYLVEGFDQQGDPIQFGNVDRLGGASPPALTEGSSSMTEHVGQAFTIPSQDGKTSWRVIYDRVPHIIFDNLETGQTQSETVTLIVGEQIGNIEGRLEGILDSLQFSAR